MSVALDSRELAFLERVFETRALAAEYPLVFDPRLAPGSGGETVAILEGGEVRAACAILTRTFRVGPHAVRAGLIGSVATDPAFRRRGLATRLLNEAERRLEAKGCTFALLWAEEPDFYLKRGYEPFASEQDYWLVSELAPLLPAPDGVRELRAGDEPLLRHLHAAHSTRIERTPEEMLALLGVPGMLTLVRERSAAPGHPVQPVAYACLGRGRDLTDAVHEWAGETEDVLALLRAHLERRFPDHQAGALFLMAPPTASELAYRLVTLGAVTKPGILGLGKLLDSGSAGRLLAAALGDEEALSWQGEQMTLRGPCGRAALDRASLQALLFGGPEVRDEVRTFLARVGFSRARLPLEPFAFGLDSI